MSNSNNLPDGSVDKESTCKVGDTGDAGSISELRRSSGGGYGNLIQYSNLENLHVQSLMGYSPWN